MTRGPRDSATLIREFLTLRVQTEGQFPLHPSTTLRDVRASHAHWIEFGKIVNQKRQPRAEYNHHYQSGMGNTCRLIGIPEVGDKSVSMQFLRLRLYLRY